ncbi:hypothetical protein O999_25105 [Pseudomonas putida LF54]|nr:hypothetical protein O999_25105 [Pseudomonas putida LF54]
MDGHRVRPVQLREFRVAYCQVTSETVIETVFRECTAGCNEMFLTILPLFFVTFKVRNFRKDQTLLFRLINRNAALSVRCWFNPQQGIHSANLIFYCFWRPIVDFRRMD